MPHDSSSGPTCHRPSEAATVGQRKQDHGWLLIGYYYGTCMPLLLLPVAVAVAVRVASR